MGSFRWEGLTFSVELIRYVAVLYLAGWGVAFVLAGLVAFLAKQPDY